MKEELAIQQKMLSTATNALIFAEGLYAAMPRDTEWIAQTFEPIKAKAIIEFTPSFEAVFFELNKLIENRLSLFEIASEIAENHIKLTNGNIELNDTPINIAIKIAKTVD